MHHDHHHGHSHKHDIPAECPASKCPELSASAAPKCPASDEAAGHIKKIKETFNLKSDAEAVKTALAWTAHMASAHSAVGKKDDACCDTKKECCDTPKAKTPGCCN